MPTTSQGIYYPDSTTNVAPLHTVFSTMASSIDNILAGDVQIHKVANTTARNALVSQFPPSAANPLFVWRADATNGRELEYTKNGTTWHYVNTSEDDTGWVNVLPSGWTGTAAVRRIGNIVTMRGRVNRTAGNFSTATTVFTLPPEFRTSSFTFASTITTSASVMAYLAIGADGVVSIAPFSSGNNFFINTTWMLD